MRCCSAAASSIACSFRFLALLSFSFACAHAAPKMIMMRTLHHSQQKEESRSFLLFILETPLIAFLPVKGKIESKTFFQCRLFSTPGQHD